VIQVVWEFVVKASALDEFQRAYGPKGPWSRLFQAYPGYRGTTLLRDTENSSRFITIDVWASRPQRDRMLTEAKSEYAAIDRLLAELTERENEIGIFSNNARVSNPTCYSVGR
jgi:heme-degrading monooxygenase HmoA